MNYNTIVYARSKGETIHQIAQRMKLSLGLVSDALKQFSGKIEDTFHRPDLFAPVSPSWTGPSAFIRDVSRSVHEDITHNQQTLARYQGYDWWR